MRANRGPSVLVAASVVSHCDQTVATCTNVRETGGILLGNIRGPHLEITGFSRKGESDQSEMFSFTRQDPSHERLAMEAWQSSSFTTTFIGEWHTHPVGGAEASGIDMASWRNLAKRSGHAMSFIVIAPGGWAVYLVRQRLFMFSVQKLPRSESGLEGVVFGSMV